MLIACKAMFSGIEKPADSSAHLFNINILKMSGSRLLSHIVSNIVPSAARIFTVVFGMGTGVASARIATRQIYQRIIPVYMKT